MPALVLIFPVLALICDQGIHAKKHSPMPLAAPVAHMILLDKPYSETITLTERP